MKKISELNLGSVDAVNYKTKAEKEFFSKILHKDVYLEKLLEQKKYFLIGEKGTGKTSYSVFLNNTDYKNTMSRSVSLTQTDYRRFISLMDSGKFTVSSYVDIWRVILLLMASETIYELFGQKSTVFSRFNALKKAIDTYYNSSFRPEVDQSLDIVENSGTAAKLMSQFAELGFDRKKELKTEFTNINVNLSYIEKSLKHAISSLRLERNFILFIDGIDIRPNQIRYDNYIECIKGLANAAWELNSEYFSNIKDSKFHMKIVLLMRPDILDNMGFQNLNAKVRDNGIVLNWATSYAEFKRSNLFKLVSGTLSKQQDTNIKSEEAWRHYFPYDLTNLMLAGKVDDPFVGLLRYSFYRPRDIVQYIQLMKENIIAADGQDHYFTENSFISCQKEFSDYLLGEVKDYLGFYYSDADFDEVIGFFSQFKGRSGFTWEEFCEAFDRQKQQLGDQKITIPELTTRPEDLLQFLYSLNIIGYREKDDLGSTFIHYSFRDRTVVKLRPKVRYGLEYQVHPGLQRSLLVGGNIRRRR